MSFTLEIGNKTRAWVTRSAPDIEEVSAYMTAVEELGGEMVSITPEGSHQYPTALMPHTTYRIWAYIPEGSHDKMDKIFDREMDYDNED